MCFYSFYRKQISHFKDKFSRTKCSHVPKVYTLTFIFANSKSILYFIKIFVLVKTILEVWFLFLFYVPIHHILHDLKIAVDKI